MTPTIEDVQQDFKELNVYFNDLYHHGVNQVKDSGHLWIEFSDKFRAFEKRILAASLNRQGCRWTKASEQMPKLTNGYAVQYVFRIEFLDNIQLRVMTANQFRDFIKTNFNLIDKIEYLDESIEPCATSSENFWTEEMILRFAELYRWSSTRISVKLFKESPDWHNVNIDDAKKISEIHETPSPTGDRDCEELKDGLEEALLLLDNSRAGKIAGADIDEHIYEFNNSLDKITSFIEQLLNKHP